MGRQVQIRKPPLERCPDCGSEHLRPVPCGLSWIERMRSSHIHPDATPSRDKTKYWDQQALDDQFGEEATEKSLELTDGRGFNGPRNPADEARLFE